MHSPKMNSGLMTVNNNDPENFIDDLEYFPVSHLTNKCTWGQHTPKNTTQVSILKLDGGSNSHVFTDTTMFNYIRPVKCNIQNINGRKPPAKGFGIFVVRITTTNIIITFWPSYYMPKNAQNKIIQTELKHYNEFRSLITKALIWLQTTTYTWKKL